jgi:hypothetical protein
MTGQRKTHRNGVVETGRKMPRIEVVGDICSRRPRRTQGSRTDNDLIFVRPCIIDINNKEDTQLDATMTVY